MSFYVLRLLCNLLDYYYSENWWKEMNDYEESYDFIILRGVIMNYVKKKLCWLMFKNCLDLVVILDRIIEVLYILFYIYIL